MKTGKFGVSDTDGSRYAIGFNEKTFSEHILNCGECFEIEIDDKWIGVRIEMDENEYYLIDENEKRIEIPYCSVRAKK